MFPPELDYVRARSLDEAIAMLARREDAVPIAGGQSLVPLLKLRAVSPGLLVDIRGLKELGGVEVGGPIRIGALATHSEVEGHTDLRASCPVMVEAASKIADVQVRSFGTVGGSLAHADPLADWPPVLMALDAEVHVRGPSGSRTVPMGDFVRGPYTTALERGELVTDIVVRECPRGAAYLKYAYRHGDFAIVAVAAALRVDGGHVSEARLAAIGVADRPIRLGPAEAKLAGMPVSEDAFADAAEAAARSVSPPDDHRASSEYRRALLSAFVKRALRAAAGR